jgi:hypothetical protein
MAKLMSESENANFARSPLPLKTGASGVKTIPRHCCFQVAFPSLFQNSVIPRTDFIVAAEANTLFSLSAVSEQPST